MSLRPKAVLLTPMLLFIVKYRGDRGWLSHGLVVTLPISYSLDGGTLWGFTRDMRITD